MTKLYQKCPDCHGTRRLSHDVTVATGGFFRAGAHCPCCEDGYVEFQFTVEDVGDLIGKFSRAKLMMEDILRSVRKFQEGL